MHSEFRKNWTLDEDFVFLNHGSFGAVPKAVQEHQAGLRERLASQPVRFLARELSMALAESRLALASFVGCLTEDLVLIPNATFGVNSVLHAYPFRQGDRVLVTDHEYNACRNALDAAAERAGVGVDVVALPFPPGSGEEITDAVLRAVRPETRLALLDHITSPTGLLMPIEDLVSGMKESGVHVLVDGAHGPGHVPLDLEALGADFYTGNCHKWMGTPLGTALLHCRREHQEWLRPPVVSHGRNTPLENGRTRFQEEFEWTGTFDPTPWMCIPVAISVMGKMVSGGWSEVMTRNRSLAVEARDLLGEGFEQEPKVPNDLLSAMVSFRLPDGDADALHGRLVDAGFEVPVMPWPPTPPGGHQGRILRVSCQLYNDLSDYERLLDVLPGLVLEPARESGQ